MRVGKGTIFAFKFCMLVRKIPVVGIITSELCFNFLRRVSMDVKGIEKTLESFLGSQGEDTIRKAKVTLATGYNVLEKARKALDAVNELTDAVAHAREKMKEGYEQTKTFIAPGMLENFKEVYAFLKKFGIVGALEGMVKDGKGKTRQE